MSLFGNLRRQQSQLILSDFDQQTILAAERKYNRDLAISFGSLGLSICGVLIAPVFGLLSLSGIIYGSRTIYAGAYKAIATEHRVNIDVLNAIIVTVFIGTGRLVLGSLPVAVNALRNKVLNKIKDESCNTLIDVFRQQPRFAWVLCQGNEVKIPCVELTKTHIVIVNAGEMVPVDGIIMEGSADIDQHILTGESQPVEKEVGDQVFALTVLLTGRISIQIEKTGEDTAAAQIGHILNHTVDFKTDTQLQAEEMVDRAILPTLLLGGLSLPIIGASSAMAILHAPPLNGIINATSIGMLNHLNMASRAGILIKDGRTLELLNKVDTIIFDKTGTLTEERPHVGNIYTYSEMSANAVLRYSAAAESKQTHPIAQAIVAEAIACNLSLPTLDKAEYKVGYGLTVSIEKRVVWIGSKRFIEMLDIEMPQAAIEKQTWCHSQGYSLIFVAIDGVLVGAIELQPTLRPEVKNVLHQLRQRHIKSVIILSGDHDSPTKLLADALGIDQYYAQVLPEQKAKLIEQLQQAGRSICFVGDGVNDAIALKKAHVSVSLRGASSIATDTAQVILMDQNLHQLCHLFDLASDYAVKMQLVLKLVLVPTLIGISGTLFFHFGFVHMVLLNQLGFLTSVASTLMPSLQQQQQKQIGLEK